VVADALAAALPDARVLPYAKGLDNLAVGQPVVMVYRASVVPSIVQGTRTDEIAVWVVVPNADPAKTDDLLDDLLDDVLAVLELKPNLPSLSWSEATRDVLFDTWPAYRVTATILTAKE
jgi:hypothetical protein